MKVGDLVAPMITCSGEPGDIKCQMALVLRVRHRKHDTNVKIICDCGTSHQYAHHLEIIEGIEKNDL